jgi:DNA-binding MarR family transcriptional regulator
MKKNPYHWMIPNVDLFYGTERLELINQIISGLKKGESFAVIGGRRLGKTTFLRKLKEEIMKENSFLLPVYIDAQSMPGASSASGAFSWIRNCVQQSIEVSLSEDGWEWIREVTNVTRYLKLVLLIDEFDIFREYSWCSVFFDNLRAVLHNMPGISERLAMVITGARMMQTLRDGPGSPLANVLTWKYLYLLNEEDTKNLVHEPTHWKFGDDVSDAIWAETGGHPFLIQYLMHYLFEKAEGTDKNQQREALESAKIKFLEEHSLLFKQWWFDHLEEEEREVYRLLRTRGKMNAVEISERLGSKIGTVKEYLQTLAYTGVVRRVKESGSIVFAVSGSMFDQWVEENDVIKRTHVPGSASLHELFDELETKVRLFVTHYLIDTAKLQNLPKLFGDEVRKANENYKKSRNTDDNCPLEQILEYSDFSFPFLIILRFWREFYQNRFSAEERNRILGRDPNKAKQRFEERYEVLTRIRNNLRHSRPISENDRDKARVFCRDILSLIVDDNR